MAGRRQKRDKKRMPRPEGQLRQSQLITTFGPGSMVDLVDRAVVIGGLEHWGYGRDDSGEPLDDPRLRRSLIPRLKALHPDLDLAREHYFRKAPEGDSRDPFPSVGVRALEFPRWFVCQGCRRQGQERNIEVGVLLRDPRIATHLARQWMSLVSGGLVGEAKYE